MATAKEMRQLNPEDLQKRAVELKEALFNQRIKHRTGSLESSAEIGKNKRELARVLTILGEKARTAKPAEKKA
ncbi:MAG: 50S ribosomal protein L29 [Deltaproteobacteria bacterium]|nr:50S ribosomal protein L29 [Deltaproteobacteria bacterium]